MVMKALLKGSKYFFFCLQVELNVFNFLQTSQPFQAVFRTKGLLMWYVMSNIQHSYELSDRLIRAISNWGTLSGQDDVETLLEQGVDVNRQHGTLLPLHVACMVGDSYSLRLLLDRGARVCETIVCISSLSVPSSQLALLLCCANFCHCYTYIQINALDGYGRAALHYAAEKDPECLELLLSHGADPNIRDSNQGTAAHWASFKNNAECLHLLLQNGADVNARDFNNATPLSWAAMKGNLETMKVLLEYNANVSIANHSGHIPLARTATIQATGLNTHKDDACLELLLKSHGQIDLRGLDGQLPSVLSSDNRMRELLTPHCKNSSQLQALCRFAVRSYLGSCYLPNVVPKLPIPVRLQEYLLLQR